MIVAKASLFDVLGDLVVFRDLDPVDRRLPRFADAWPKMGLPGPARPRKLEPEYAQALVWLLRRARTLDAPGVEIRELVLVGDNRLSDGSAFQSVRAAGGWQGWAFIGSDRAGEASISEEDGVFAANRWSALATFVARLLAVGARLDHQTAVIVDIDKTALGARGRNDGAIDGARATAIEATAADALGSAFDRTGFRRAYATLNVPGYHPFTADNQDNLAYTCLMLGARITSLEELQAAIADGRLAHFRQFIDQVERGRAWLPSPALQALHDEIYRRVLAGDPTPFKAFRRREYLETVTRMGYLPDETPLPQLLAEEICLTQEVMDVIAWLRRRDCLLMALSDKPDEATMPTPEIAAQGYKPLHCIKAHVVGPKIDRMLPPG